MHWYAVILVYFHWSLLNWRNFVAYSFCWYMIQFLKYILFCFFVCFFFFDLIIVIYCFDTLNMEDVFSCDQAALWMVQSVCPSVCPSVRPSVRPSVTPFWLCSHHPVIMKFSGVITSDKSDVHEKGQGQRSKVKVTEVTTQLNRFRTVTPV